MEVFHGGVILKVKLTGILIKLPYGVICDDLRQLMLSSVLVK